MAFKKYSYYLKGNKVAIVESDFSSSSGTLAVAHCTLSGYTTKDTCEAAGGQWIPSSGSSLNGVYEKYVSPKASIADGLEIEYSYSPIFNRQALGHEGADLHKFLGWGSNGTNLLLFTYGEDAVADISSLFAADDWVYISGSGRWSGLHQVKSTGGTTGVLTLKTKCNLKASMLDDITTTFVVDETIVGYGSSGVTDVQVFSDNLEEEGGSSYYFITDAADAENNGLFSSIANSSNATLGVGNKITITSSSGAYTSTAADIQAAVGDTVDIYQAFYEQITVYEGVNVLEDESFELDLTRYQAQAIVYYLKAKLAEDMVDVEGREYFMRLFKKQLEKERAGRKRGLYTIQGFFGMRNY